MFERLNDLEQARGRGLIPIVLMNENETQKMETEDYLVIDRDWFLDSLTEWNPLPFHLYRPRDV